MLKSPKSIFLEGTEYSANHQWCLPCKCEGFTVYPQVLTNVRVTDKKAAQDDADVQAAVKKVTEELGDTGRILVRESGTEPVVRVMVEAESEEICQKYVDMVVNVIKENGYVAG